jgi:hypothetical protein
MILKIQERLMQLGYQWQEKIFNDGGPNCRVQIAKDKDCHTFSPGHNLLGDVGWGRFDRDECWGYVSKWLDITHPLQVGDEYSKMFSGRVVIKSWITGRILLTVPPCEGFRLMGATSRYDEQHCTSEVRNLDAGTCNQLGIEFLTPVTFHHE